ncbi:hypothetical protein H5154_22400 [Pseudoalteromonas sp. SR44-5]|uniref:hypothetical protein n=1 Tax=unclassified Pseudoalteromonas TaxID=194690 RepID=UPI001601E414|nr:MULTISPECIES: hypothetical protein [unclassified Pseudoalteromonas]MBB1335986.1 hypothetical protein [Pseudoalteromonas sp. SR41-6]MBB1343543.1 hypothetical protein [Pseudoalteromonas sp. SR45-6]MBB1369087.1 hypothetical protein [Pseudoalteromonas sp. SR44-5]MBB1420181.1 hypothetical protein [Pseudoalteromonas sp. SG44-1]MBB1424676.1 hypothetical protein [Pseudoalteromonas sp. SG43-7]
MENLPIDLRDKIDALYISAYKALEVKNVDIAKKKADEAWGLLPEPKFDWDVTLSFVTAICEMYRELTLYNDALQIIEQLLEYRDKNKVGGFHGGIIFLKATIYYEMEQLPISYQWFNKANDMSRGRCFVDEPKKYKTFFNEYNQ